MPDTVVIKGHWKSLGYVFLFYQSMLQVFLEMEINGLIKEDNLTLLKDILQRVRPDLKKRIDAYEEKRKGKSISSAAQEQNGTILGSLKSPAIRERFYGSLG